MNLKPLHDYVLIEPDKPVTEINGIIVAKANAKETEAGTVIACGPDADLKPGIRVMFKDFSLIPVKVNEEFRGKMREREYVFLKYEEIICQL